MNPMTLKSLTEQLELGEQLLAGKDTMIEPQDLPGRFGRVVAAVDRILDEIQCESVVGGEWAVWRHGFLGRITQDIDIVLPEDRIDDFLRVASVSGFDPIPASGGRWPKVWHKDTDIKVDILPEGGTPGSAQSPAPTTIPHPSDLGASGYSLCYMQLSGLIQLKLGASRARDEADVVELIRVNKDRIAEIRADLAAVHTDYVAGFNHLVGRAAKQQDE